MRTHAAVRLAIGFAVGGAVASATAGEQGLVGLWCLDEPDGVVVRDSGPLGLDGSIVFPENVERVAGRSGNAIRFAGEGELNKCSCAVAPKLPKDRFAEGMTIQAWIRFRADHKRSDTCFIACNGDWKGPGFRFFIHYDMLVVQSGDGTETWGANSRPAQYGGFANERWYHVAGTFDGTHYRVFIDGIEQGSAEIGKAVTSGKRSLSIGCFGGGRTGQFKGTIDEFRVYSRAKSALEIAKDARLR